MIKTLCVNKYSGYRFQIVAERLESFSRENPEYVLIKILEDCVGAPKDNQYLFIFQKTNSTSKIDLQ